jgi:2-methylcitrate dehydratase PrpD
MPAARRLAEWAVALEPTADDLALADRALLDTVAVALAARPDPVVEISRSLPEPARWAALAHVLDFDDLHLESTTHVSAVCVPAVLAAGGGARAYLGAAGVMARLGTALGWPHYTAGWHTTCTAGAPAAAVGAALALGLDVEQVTTAIVLAVPAAGGVQRAFGTTAKSLQVGFAAEAGVRAARLARDGASADPLALEQWLANLGSDPEALDLTGPAVPGSLAIKLYPCCYALQRPIGAIRDARPGPIEAGQVHRIRLTTPAGTVTPLIHHRPASGLEGKFSLEYAVATAVLDEHSGFAAFTDAAVRRPEAQRLIAMVETELTDGGEGLLDGRLTVEVELSTGESLRTGISEPAGSPGRPPTDEELAAKLVDCGIARDHRLSWSTAAGALRSVYGPGDPCVGATR